MRKLPRSFYTQRTLTVAKELLGKTFVRKMGKKYLTGKIVEVEAYRGSKDPASHSYRGMTERTRVMFNRGGFLYVYFTYGMHYCANVVTYKEGIGEAVLIRAVEPIDGIEVMMKNRFDKDGVHLKGGLHLRNISNGPAKFAQAFGLHKDHTGMDLLGSEVFISDESSIPKSMIVSATRIGISVGKEKKWRFYIKGNAWVSKK